ncbi:hypothetical protein KSX_17720 [Ktedonospora formicarum]|uniref:Uncharacterized protein n=1 Tax=Ktedonospora formicarum TaxID=2778364 RepID=A0A8J3I147_9CHLR|nr:hypothetical protein KSX_17720 [Ktedonospora formicarum]
MNSIQHISYSPIMSPKDRALTLTQQALAYHTHLQHTKDVLRIEDKQEATAWSVR